MDLFVSIKLNLGIFFPKLFLMALILGSCLIYLDDLLIIDVKKLLSDVVNSFTLYVLKCKFGTILTKTQCFLASVSSDIITAVF